MTTTDAARLADVRKRMVIAIVVSCSCNTKTHEAQYHDPQCLYRVLSDADAELSRLSSENAALRSTTQTLVTYARWQISEGKDHHPTLPSAVSQAESALAATACDGVK